jgi:hypothetical protein
MLAASFAPRALKVRLDYKTIISGLVLALLTWGATALWSGVDEAKKDAQDAKVDKVKFEGQIELMNYRLEKLEKAQEEESQRSKRMESLLERVVEQTKKK